MLTACVLGTMHSGTSWCHLKSLGSASIRLCRAAPSQIAFEKHPIGLVVFHTSDIECIETENHIS